METNKGSIDTIDLYKNGDYQSCFGSDAICVSQVLGLTRQTAKRKDGTTTNHCAFLAANLEEYQELLEDAGYAVSLHNERPDFI